MCTPSLTWKLLASLSLGSASTRRSPATSGRCWACRRLAMVAVKGARWQGTGRGYMVSCALRRLKHALVPVVGNNAIHIFKCCRPDTRVETRADMDFEKMPMRGGCSSAMARSCKWAPHPNTPAAAGQLLDGACLRNFAVARGAAAAHACAQ